MQETEKTANGKMETLQFILKCHKGQKEAVSMEHLCGLLKISDKQLKGLIYEMVVLMHIPVIGDNHGYYLAESKDEINKHLKVLKSRTNATHERYNAMLAISKSYGKR